MARQQLNGWCGRPLPDDRDGWRTRAFAFKDLAQEREREVERLKEENARLRANIVELCNLLHGTDD